jgi:hypothetical protein
LILAPTSEDTLRCLLVKGSWTIPSFDSFKIGKQTESVNTSSPWGIIKIVF